MFDSMLLLIPLSLLFVFVVAAVLWWAVSSGQFEDTGRAGESILKDDDSTDNLDDS